MKTLLACVDTSQYAESVVDHAAWAARPLHAAVELLHVVQRTDAVAARHDHSGAMGLGAKSALLEELAAIDEQQARLAKRRGQDLLDAAAERLRTAGVQDVITTHRHGGILETIVEREADADLVILGKRGSESAFADGHLGSQIERTVRESIRPVMMVPKAFRAQAKVLIAFDGGATARQAVEFAAHSPLLQGLTVEVVSAGAPNRHRDSDQAWARGALPGRAVVRSVEGSPEEALPRLVEAEGFDLVLMGAYGHSPLRRLLVGSTTTMVMRALHVPVLLFR